MARRETLAELEARTLREQGDLPPPLGMDEQQSPRRAISYAPVIQTPDVRDNTSLMSEYNIDETPVSYRQRTVLKANPMSPWTRLKPLLPNILDRAAVLAVHKNAAIRKASGRKWVPVQEK